MLPACNALANSGMLLPCMLRPPTSRQTSPDLRHTYHIIHIYLALHAKACNHKANIAGPNCVHCTRGGIWGHGLDSNQSYTNSQKSVPWYKLHDKGLLRTCQAAFGSIGSKRRYLPAPELLPRPPPSAADPRRRTSSPCRTHASHVGRFRSTRSRLHRLALE